jgi:hypothetical protein
MVRTIGYAAASIAAAAAEPVIRRSALRSTARCGDGMHADFATRFT